MASSSSALAEADYTLDASFTSAQAAAIRAYVAAAAAAARRFTPDGAVLAFAQWYGEYTSETVTTTKELAHCPLTYLAYVDNVRLLPGSLAAEGLRVSLNKLIDDGIYITTLPDGRIDLGPLVAAAKAQHEVQPDTRKWVKRLLPLDYYSVPAPEHSARGLLLAYVHYSVRGDVTADQKRRLVDTRIFGHRTDYLSFLAMKGTAWPAFENKLAALEAEVNKVFDSKTVAVVPAASTGGHEAFDITTLWKQMREQWEVQPDVSKWPVRLVPLDYYKDNVGRITTLVAF